MEAAEVIAHAGARLYWGSLLEQAPPQHGSGAQAAQRRRQHTCREVLGHRPQQSREDLGTLARVERRQERLCYPWRLEQPAEGEQSRRRRQCLEVVHQLDRWLRVRIARQADDMSVGTLQLRSERLELRFLARLPRARQRTVPSGECVRDGLIALAHVTHRLLALLVPLCDGGPLLLARVTQLRGLEEVRPARRVAARVAARETLVVVCEDALEQLGPQQREQA